MNSEESQDDLDIFEKWTPRITGKSPVKFLLLVLDTMRLDNQRNADAR
jgi:hypothetical protein